MSARLTTPPPSSASAVSSGTSGDVASSSNSTHATTPATPSGGDKSSSSFTPGKGRRRREFALLVLATLFRRRARYGEQTFSMEGQNLGPVPVDMFMMELLPLVFGISGEDAFKALTRLAAGVSVAEAWKEVPQESGGEKEVYEALRKIFQRLIPKDTHNIKLVDHTTGETFRPDFMALGEDFEDDELLRLLAFMSAELFGEVKPKSQDPVGQIAGESGSISDTAERRHARGQIGTYSEVILLAGFRTGIFSFVVVLPNTGRLVYHDRGGMIFSDEFNFRTSGVLERYAVLLEGVSDAQRGRDTSVVMLAQDSPEALLALQILLEQDLPEGLDATDILPICTKSEKDSTMIFDTSAGDLAMMLVLEERKSRFHRIVVHRPFYCDTSGLTGEGTRHFYGIELDERILVHVQEDWRVTLDGMIPETDLYEILESQDVHYLPEHLFGGDVPYNTFELFGKYRTQPIPRDLLRGIRYFDTFTHGFAQRHTGKIQRFWSDYCKQPKDAVEILPRRLHRMVFKSIPLLLSKYKSTKQLAQVVRDAVQCHDEAYQLGFLHRNVGGHSIFINARTGRGMLMQWAQFVIWSLVNAQQRSRGRSVCWEFMSGALLAQNPDRPHLLRDDLESFLHVLVYYALRYRPVRDGHGAIQPLLLKSLQAVFDQAHLSVSGSEDGASTVGGAAKRAYLGTPCNVGEHFADEHLVAVDMPMGLLEIIQQGRDTFRPLYVPPPIKKIPGPRYDNDLARWQTDHDTAVVQVSSSAALLAAFDAGLNPSEEARAYMVWPTSDGAVDQYPHEESNPVEPFQGSLASRHAQTEPPNGGKSLKRSRDMAYPPGSGNIERSSADKKSRF